MVENVALGFQPGTYNPQVEAISPTLPEQISQEDQAFKTTKDELIQQISKVDREILKAEQQIVILKKKQAELEEVANKPSVKNEVEEDAQPKHQSLPQVIPLPTWQYFTVFTYLCTEILHVLEQKLNGSQIFVCEKVLDQKIEKRFYKYLPGCCYKI